MSTRALTQLLGLSALVAAGIVLWSMSQLAPSWQRLAYGAGGTAALLFGVVTLVISASSSSSASSPSTSPPSASAPSPSFAPSSLGLLGKAELEQIFTQHHQQWLVTRAMIQHEDELIHQRMTSYLTTQGFLFTAFGAVSGGWLTWLTRADSDQAKTNFGPDYLFVPVGIVLLVLCGSAMALAFHTKDAVDAATQQISRTKWWWADYSGERLRDDSNVPFMPNRPFPPIIGQWPHGTVIDQHILRLLYAWSALLSMVLASMIHQGSSLVFDSPWPPRCLWVLVAVTVTVVGCLYSHGRWEARRKVQALADKEAESLLDAQKGPKQNASSSAP